jgi:hypothetical protein
MTTGHYIDKITPHFGVENVSERVAEFHADFAEQYGSNYHTLVKEIKPALEEVPTHNPFFDDHGPRHSYRIINNICILVSESGHDLTPFEKYVLASCAWLHDIGMCINQKIDSDDILSDALNDFPEWFADVGTTSDDDTRIDDGDLIRKWHHILSWHFIRQHEDVLGFPNFGVANTVASICKVHREGVDLPEGRVAAGAGLAPVGGPRLPDRPGTPGGRRIARRGGGSGGGGVARRCRGHPGSVGGIATIGEVGCLERDRELRGRVVADRDSGHHRRHSGRSFAAVHPWFVDPRVKLIGGWERDFLQDDFL